MTRLTKKDPCINCEKENECYVNCKDEFWFYKEIKSKLGRLEDLEEELGCPLEVFVGIMLGKITEIVVNYSDAAGYEPLYEELTIAYVSGIIESYEHRCLCVETNLCDVPIKDYQKNWWLKGER